MSRKSPFVNSSLFHVTIRVTFRRIGLLILMIVPMVLPMLSEHPESSTLPGRVRLITLGCRANQYESQRTVEMLESAGWTVAEESSPADLCIINTCTVTHDADAKARLMVRRLGRENPGAQIGIMGCATASNPDQMAALPGVTTVIDSRGDLATQLQRFGVVSPGNGISRFDQHQRAFLKVQDGCLLDCAYCIIPKVRPKFGSRPLTDILLEARRLVDAGYREIVLTGIHLGHYGLDLSRGLPKDQWTRLWHLLDALLAIPGGCRFRLSSLDAAEAHPELIARLAGSPRVAPHVHLCLQSGSDAVLKRMRRRYTVASYLDRCDRIREALDNPGLSTDIIVGFPGETDADFEATLATARAARFSDIHVFSYSPRRGTDAFTMPDTLPPEIIRERRLRLESLAGEMAADYRSSLVGSTLGVVVESAQDSDWVVGTACRGVKVRLRGSIESLRRQLVDVVIESSTGDLLTGAYKQTLSRLPLATV